MAGTQTLVDNFNDNSLDSDKWVAISSLGTVSEESGMVVLTVSPSIPGSWAAIISKNFYSLVGSYAYVNVKQADTSVEVLTTAFSIEVSGGHLIFECYSGVLNANYYLGTKHVLATVAYDPVAMAWWRFKEDNGTVYWDYSADRASWTNLSSVASPFDVSSVQIEFQAHEWGAVPIPVASWFDNFNVAYEKPLMKTSGNLRIIKQNNRII